MNESQDPQGSPLPEHFIEQMKNPGWRLNNLYRIKDTQGKDVLFRLNWAQAHFLNNLHTFNVVLKARQLGFSTVILLYMLDSALFNPGQDCGVVAQGLKEAEDLFDNKIKFAYERLDPAVQAMVPAVQNSSRSLSFANGSSFTVGTSLRGGTIQKLHISEYGKIAARYPEKALEIKTGALNTVHVGQQIFVESTAEGQQGEFFDLCETARKLADAGKPLTSLDPKFHFYPWYKHPGYTLPDKDIGNVSINSEYADYFRKLESSGITLTPGQKCWYVKKAEIQGDHMKREFPSVPEEAFEASLEGAYYTKEMALVRRNKQITHVPWEPSKPVDTFWDIGLNDLMTVWFFQHIGDKYRFIRYAEGQNEGWEYYANLLRSTGYVFGTHYWPHDGNKRILGAQVITGKQVAEGLGIRPITIVPRTNDVSADIRNHCKPVLPRCWFDEANCAAGIKHLDAYRKEWDERLGVWKESPLHNDASHGCDAFRTFAMGYRGRKEEFIDYSHRQQFADGDYNMYG